MMRKKMQNLWPLKTMAACIHNSRTSTEAAASPFSQDSADHQCQIRNSPWFAKKCKPSFQNLFSCDPIKRVRLQADKEDDVLWLKIREQALCDMEQEPILSKYYCSSILQHDSLESALVAHKLWSQGRIVMALLIQSRVSETAVIGDNVTILHNVTLGGTGKVNGDRHPKVGDGVLIGAGTKVLGSIRVGDRAKIGAGSVVLKEVPPETTSVGNPARLKKAKIMSL
ncbi:unnamed protein product, partial [Vitis vinifera]